MGEYRPNDGAPEPGGQHPIYSANVAVHAASVSDERLLEVCLPALRQTQASLRAQL